MKRKLLVKCNFLLLFLILIFSSFTVNAQEETTVIKVGYTLNYGTIKSPIVIGEEGYGYEYLNKIFDYVEGDYELEFIYCEWVDVSDMMASGEIDVFGPITYTEASAETFLFTEENFGDNFIFLSTLEENGAVDHNYDNVDNSIIAVQEGNPNEYLLHDFLEEHDLDAEIVYFTEDDYENVMQENGYDFCLCSSLQSYSNLIPVVNLGVVDAYYVTNPENVELMNLIDEAMEEVRETEYMYQEKLYLEYYDYSILSDSYITEDEHALLQEQELYYIGIENIYGPIGYKNEDGEFQGIAVDTMEMIAEIAGIDYVFVEVTEDTTREELEALDFSFLSYDENGRENTIESDSFCEMPYILVERPMDDTEEITTIGILTHYGLNDASYEGYLFDREIWEYDSLLGIQEAYNNGEIDSMIMTTSNMNMVRNGFENLDYLVTTLDISLNMSLIFREDYSEEKLNIFNKIIGQLDEKEINAAVLEHSTTESTGFSFEELIREYPYAILGMILFLSMLVIGEVIMVSQQRRNHLAQLLNYDKLTGLYSGHRFEECTREILEKEDETLYSIVTIDIDHFKYINDVFGYETGDKVIKIVAGCIKKIDPESILIARNTSDIFLVLIKRELNEERKLQFSAEDREKLLCELIPYIGENYRISFSIGVYDIVDRSLDINFMIDCANIARLEGKRFVHTTVNAFSRDMDKKRQMSTNLITNMVKGIKEHEFIVYYQPKYGLKSKKTVGAEALVRWVKDGMMIPPGEFIPLFEKNGFIENLDFYVLEAVCAFLNTHPDAPVISVNLSGVTVVRHNVAWRLLEVVERYHVPYEKIEFEITETAFVGEYEEVIHTLDILRKSGFTISIDDFGVGISCLSRLKSLPIDILKIDRDFIWDSIGNEKGIEVLKNIINMANDLKLKTIAEGIETVEQEQLLLRLGCEMGQGYYYSRPLPEAEFVQKVEID